MSKNVPKKRIPRKERLSKILELRGKGWKKYKIAEELNISRKTITRDINSQEYSEFIDEIIRQQLADIIEGDLKVRLQYRDKILDKIIPKQIQTKSESTHKVTWEAWKPDSSGEE